MLPPQGGRRAALAATERFIEQATRTLDVIGYDLGTVRRLQHPIEGPPEARCPDVWNRTWNVQLSLSFRRSSPAYNSASLAFRNLLLGRTRQGWRVWLQLH